MTTKPAGTASAGEARERRDAAQHAWITSKNQSVVGLPRLLRARRVACEPSHEPGMPRCVLGPDRKAQASGRDPPLVRNKKATFPGRGDPRKMRFAFEDKGMVAVAKCNADRRSGLAGRCHARRLTLPLAWATTRPAAARARNPSRDRRNAAAGHRGGVAEWLKAAVLKTARRESRGFESLLLRPATLIENLEDPSMETWPSG